MRLDKGDLCLYMAKEEAGWRSCSLRCELSAAASSPTAILFRRA
jgi:hypothetical protein